MSAQVFFAPVRSPKKLSLVTRAGHLLERAGLRDAVADGDLVAIKTHFGETGNTGFVQPIYLREVVARVRAHGGKPFLTDANTPTGASVRTRSTIRRAPSATASRSPQSRRRSSSPTVSTAGTPSRSRSPAASTSSR
jgi:uncharacterized Fe-S center protein